MKVASKNSVPYILQMSAAKSSRLAEKIPEIDELGLGQLSKEESRFINRADRVRTVDDKDQRKDKGDLRLPKLTVKIDMFMLRGTARQTDTEIKLRKEGVKVGPHMDLNRGAYRPGGPALGAPPEYKWA